MRTDFQLQDEPQDSLVLYAPSLKALPEGGPLALATLPVVDWNLELQKALERLTDTAPSEAYAAVFMIDPFTLWEDLASLLKSRNITGVVNFPPAGLSEGSSFTSTGTVNSSELDRMKWFSDAGFKVLHAAATEEEIRTVRERLGEVLEGSLHLGPAALGIPVSSRIELQLKDLDPKDDVNLWVLQLN